MVKLEGAQRLPNGGLAARKFVKLQVTDTSFICFLASKAVSLTHVPPPPICDCSNNEHDTREAQLSQRDRATRHDSKFVPRFTGYGSYKGFKQQK